LPANSEQEPLASVFFRTVALIILILISVEMFQRAPPQPVTLATIAPSPLPQPEFRQPQQPRRFFPQQQQQRFQQGKRRN